MNAESTGGWGGDVLLSDDNYEIYLSVEEAEALAAELLNAARDTREYQRDLAEYLEEAKRIHESKDPE